MNQKAYGGERRTIDTNHGKKGYVTKAYNALLFVFSSLFFGYVAVRMIFPLLSNKSNPLKGFAGAAAIFAGFLALWALDRLLIRRMGRKAAIVSIAALISINLLFQVVCLYLLRVKPSWDFGAIMSAAQDISSGQPIRNWKYFQEYPYNIYPAVIVGSFQFLAGGSGLAPYLLNLLCVTASILGACLLSYRVYGQRAGVLTALFCLALTPFYLYIPIVYTDTLSMPFAVWSVYVWSRIRTGNAKTGYPFVWLGLLSATGFLIKQIAAIGLAAFAVDFLLDREGYGKTGGIPVRKSLAGKMTGLLPTTVAFLTFFVVVSAFRFYVEEKGFDVRIDHAKSLPYTHWLMMGMNTVSAEGGTSSGYGGFSAADLHYSRLFVTSEDKKNAEISLIKSRLNTYGLDGYAAFLLKKMEWTWTDGTYFVPVKLGRYPLHRTILHRMILAGNGRLHKAYLAFTQFIQALLLSMIFAGCLRSLKKCPDGTFRLMTLMSMGLMVFLLFWETRSRYLAFLLPVFAVMTVYGMLAAFRGLDRILSRLGNQVFHRSQE